MRVWVQLCIMCFAGLRPEPCGSRGMIEVSSWIIQHGPYTPLQAALVDSFCESPSHTRLGLSTWPLLWCNKHMLSFVPAYTQRHKAVHAVCHCLYIWIYIYIYLFIYLFMLWELLDAHFSHKLSIVGACRSGQHLAACLGSRAHTNTVKQLVCLAPARAMPTPGIANLSD